MNGYSYQAVIDKLHDPIFDEVKPNEHLLFIEATTDDLDPLF